MSQYEIIALFFLVAMLYASVGFGGGSSYLAIMALYSFDYQTVRITALFCNLAVVSGGCYIFFKAGHFKWKKMSPLVLASVPLAFFGGRMRIEEPTFFILLGFSLLIAGVLILLIKGKNEQQGLLANSNPWLNSTVGGGIGYLSGLVGIGGGIFLSPVLYLMKWDTAKTIAATASFYILVNSLSGIAGQLSHGIPVYDWKMIAILAGSVLAGGQIGSRIGAKVFSQNTVQRATGVLILIVALRVLIKYL